MRSAWRLRNSVILTNVALAVVIGLQCWFLGWGEFLLVQMPCAMIAATAGVLAVLRAAPVEDVYREDSSEWSYADAALRGSSHPKPLKLLQFFTGNIGLHHVHHLNARIRTTTCSAPTTRTLPFTTSWC